MVTVLLTPCQGLDSSPSPFSSALLIVFTFFGNKLFSTCSTHGQSGCLSCMHSSPSSSSFVLPALYILIPQFPLSIPLLRYSFGLFPFSYKASIPAPLLSPMSWWWLLTPGLFSLRVISHHHHTPLHSESVLYFFISVALHPVATILPLLKQPSFSWHLFSEPHRGYQPYVFLVSLFSLFSLSFCYTFSFPVLFIFVFYVPCLHLAVASCAWALLPWRNSTPFLSFPRLLAPLTLFASIMFSENQSLTTPFPV